MAEQSTASLELEEFEAAPRHSTGIPCWYRRHNFSEEQRRRLDAALAEPRIETAQIEAVLRKWGYDVKPLSIRRHRGGDCRCV